MASVDPGRLVRGDYSIYSYTSQIYKIVRFKHTEISIRLPGSYDRDQMQHYDSKLDQSFSRARKVVLEKALCNKWDWFCTLTIDPDRYNRHNLPRFYKDFSQWLRDVRKAGHAVKYLLVPEMHKEGSWHLHGFFSGLPELISFSDLKKSGVNVPYKLVRGGFYCWPAYQERFGFGSFGKIRSPVRSAFYISKYITKDRGSMVSDLGSKLYYCSQGLSKAVKHGEVYGRSSFLDQLITADYDHCAVGMTKVTDQLNWHFALDLMEDDSPSIPFEAMQPLLDGLPDGDFFEQMSFLQDN